MIRKTVAIGLMMVFLMTGKDAKGEVCGIVNGSFEDDGRISDIVLQEPNGWEVNIPAGRFNGYVYRDWVTDGTYSLTVHLNRTTFDAGDMATVSQKLDLTDVNEIMFDLGLKRDWSQWDPHDCVAVLLIDGDIVWDSNSAGLVVSGKYPGQVYKVDDRYRDGAVHKLSLGIRVNVCEQLWERYYTYWDFVRCTVFCGGGGLLAGDFNQDCYVDFNDLNYIAGLWLDENVEPGNKCNLFTPDDIEGEGGTVTFRDFAVLAGSWDGSIADLGEFVGRWLQRVKWEDKHNLYDGDDVQPRGIINFFDFAIFSNDWLSSSMAEEPNTP